MSAEPDACGRCIARSWLLGRLAGHLEPVRSRIQSLLALDDQDLIAAVGGARAGEVLDELAAFDAGPTQLKAGQLGLELICRCSARYPLLLHALESPPAVLNIAGAAGRFAELASLDSVAIAGARRASPYGVEVARSLGRDLSTAGLTVISGMADGIDTAAHEGALAAGSRTIAVLPGAIDRPYPRAKRQLYERLIAHGSVASELPLGTSARRWTFTARNRIIAGLAAITVVIEAGERSGSLVSARIAGSLGRVVGAVPGRVTTDTARGSNALLAGGARVIRDAQDVLDGLFGAGARNVPTPQRPPLTLQEEALLRAITAGHDTPAALARVGFATADALQTLASLELGGYLARAPGGQYLVRP